LTLRLGRSISQQCDAGNNDEKCDDGDGRM
jgi:hypothetical protein